MACVRCFDIIKLWKTIIGVFMMTNEEQLMECVKMGQLDAVKTLIAKGVDVNVENNLGLCPVLIAARRNDFNILKELADAGASLDVTDNFGETVIQWANHHNNQEMINFIDDNLHRICNSTSP